MKPLLRKLGAPILWFLGHSRTLRRLKRSFGIRIPRDWYGEDRRGRIYHTERSFILGNFHNELSCRSFWFENYYEPHPMACLKALDSFVDVFIDVGANIGIYTLFVCAGGREKRVFTFDPHPEVYEMLTNNLRMNGYEATIEQLALSDHVGQAEMHFPKSETAASLESEFNPIVDFTKTVDISTVDEYFLGSDVLTPLPKPGRTFFKMDVLGHESSVLRGAHQFIEKCLPNLLLEAVKPFEESELAYLRELGYRLFLLHPDGPKEISVPRHEMVDGFAYANFIASANAEILEILTGKSTSISFSHINPEQSSLSGFMQ